MGSGIVRNYAGIRALATLVLLLALVLPAALQAQEARDKPAKSAEVGKEAAASVPAKQAPITKPSPTAENVTPESPAPAPAPPKLTLEIVRETIAGKNFGLALEQLVAIADNAPKQLNLREHRTLVADCHYAKGDLSRATKLYTTLVEGDDVPQDTWQLHAWERLAAIALAEGRTGDAQAAFGRATAIYGPVKRATVAKSSVYYRNRAELDSIPEYELNQLRQLAEAREGEEKGAETAAQLYARVFSSHPRAPDRYVIALKAADLFRKAGKQNQALGFYLHALFTDLDRCFSTTAKLSENQRYLNAVAKPLGQDHVTATLTGIRACLKSEKSPAPLTDTAFAEYATRWHAALAATHDPDAMPRRPTEAGEQWGWLPHTPVRQAQSLQPGGGAASGAGAASQCLLPAPWRQLAQVAMGRAYLRLGYYLEAMQVFEGVLAGGVSFGALEAWALVGLGGAQMGMRDFASARIVLNRASGMPDAVLASLVSLELARCYEFEQAWDAAVAANKELIASTPVAWHRRQAEYASERIAILRDMKTVDMGDGVRILPNDRTTRGDWFLGYGRSQYILCAQNYVTDRLGGAMWPRLKYTVRTTSPKETGRLWVSKGPSDDPVALWDPRRRTHIPANRDDYGEQHPLGRGPDLLVTCEVPEGNHILSLYFVNDHNYYEPNRYYTISVTDADGKLITVSDVRNFGGGVYKRFGVRGPLAVTLRIWRNLSINTLLSGIFLDPIVGAWDVPLVELGSASSSADAEMAADGKSERTSSPGAVGGSRSPSKVASGVFRPHRWRGRGNGKEGKDGLAVQYACLQSAFSEAPLESIAGAEKIHSLALALVGMTVSAEEDTTLPRLWYMLSECQRLLGQHRRSRQAFDQYLSSLENGRTELELAAVYERLARGLVARVGKGHPLHRALFRMRVFKDGEHGWDRVWSAYFANLTEAHASRPAALQQALHNLLFSREQHAIPSARLRTYALLAERFPDIAKTWEVLQVAGTAAKDQGDTKTAVEYLSRCVAAGPYELAEPKILADLVVAQSGAGEPPERIQATCDRLERYAGDKRCSALVRLSQLYLADACIRAGNPGKATEVLATHERRFGSSRWSRALAARCRQRPASKEE
ncbi:MAG: hypothetical protein HN742_03920 [Lentisphaerae bacterium]|jgi:tetratricopeptide (TPR) repeat protein|nr:hypothetical protein [Lentisphaerota bacterium]MBT4819364.1 hypothetical protein [Lentisphaerota bacterium]MBT5607290.1 hypothetical protein [Lentisphaerota bacterium]MBT7055392.1 hypothetical protein [Lentisphaerota bacterium]MBT7840990.1 hypothetical protein [Lentisphaerota bacterium]